MVNERMSPALASLRCNTCPTRSNLPCCSSRASSRATTGGQGRSWAGWKTRFWRGLWCCRRRRCCFLLLPPPPLPPPTCTRPAPLLLQRALARGCCQVLRACAEQGAEPGAAGAGLVQVTLVCGVHHVRGGGLWEGARAGWPEACVQGCACRVCSVPGTTGRPCTTPRASAPCRPGVQHRRHHAGAAEGEHRGV